MADSQGGRLLCRRAAWKPILFAPGALKALTASGGLRFRFEAGEYRFDTGMLRGTLRAGGKSYGLSEVFHVPSGKILSRAPGWAGLYRVFAANKRFMPDTWYSPSEAELREDGSVEAHWPASDDRPFATWASYRLPAPAMLDFEIRVRLQSDVAAFESFFASYFAEPFTVSKVCVNRKKPEFLAAEQSNGAWQMFPRDRASVRIIQDGRWKHPPNPVDWRIMPEFAMPLAFRRDPASGLTAVVMARSSDCIAVSTPFQTDAHRSLYLSLFGRDMKAGQTARAAIRIVVGMFSEDAEIFRAYREFGS